MAITSKKTNSTTIRTKSLYLERSMRRKNYIVLLMAWWLSVMLSTGVAKAEPPRRHVISGRFAEVSVEERSLVPVYSIVQDSLGFVWLGTDSGLFRHDGIRGQRFGLESGLCNEHVNVLSYDNTAGILYVGTDKGLCVYDNAGGFACDEAVGQGHVKAILLQGADCWIGTTGGLFLHETDADTTALIVPDVHVAGACAVEDTLFFGSYGRILRLDGKDDVKSLALAGHDGASGNLVLALAGVSADFRSGNGSEATELFVGTEKGLYRFNVTANTLDCLWNGGPVKNFLYLPDSSLAAGTDYGLLVLSTTGDISVLRHELKDSRSIPDNVVWATMLDSDGGLWVGTDHGAALTRLNDEYDFIGVGNCGMPDGLDVSSLVCTGDGHVLAAGMNGILDYCPTGGYEVLKSDAGKPGKRLAHNKVRSLYHDGGSVWAASDGGLDRIRDNRVTHYNIKETTGKYLSDWMYAVAEDSRGRLWTGTYDGGLFITSKERLGASGGEVLCDRHLSTKDGLSGDIVLRLCCFGNTVAVVTDNGVDLVSDNDFSIRHLPVPDGKRTLSLASDGVHLWIGTEAGVYALEDGELRPISGRTISAQSLTFSDGDLWLCDGDEIWKCTPDSPRWQLVRKFENPLLCIAADSGQVFAGSADGFYSMPKSLRPMETRQERIALTALFLDNVLVLPGKEYSGRVILRDDISLTDKIVLKRNQNSFALTFSPMRYPSTSGRFAYRLAGFHDEWQLCPADTRAVFLNVHPGKYSFEVCHLDPAGDPDSQIKTLEIKIKRPWYSTTRAYFAYLLIIGYCIYFAVYFRKIMNQLKQERAEKEKAQSIANSTISRTQEFRETLSVIFGSMHSKEPSDTEESDTPDSKFVKEITDIVNRHLDDPDFSAAALCEESRWPAKQVYRKIKQLTGLSTLEFIREIRLQKAASLLEQGKHSVTEIMYMSGFTTASYFSKCFKSRYGVTPSEYQHKADA